MSSSATTPSVTIGQATQIGNRSANADAATAVITPLGACAAVVDGIGSTQRVCVAARLAADVAATVGAHRGAQAGLMAAADTMLDYPGAPNAVAAVASVAPDGRIEIAHVGDVAVWTWTAGEALRRWTVDQTAGAHVDHMRHHQGLTEQEQRRLDGVVDVLGDYVLNGLAYATVSTIAWTPLRGIDPELVLITSDGVHKELTPDQLNSLIERYRRDPQTLADVIVADAVQLGDDDVVYGDTPPSPLPDPFTRDNATAAVIRLQRTA